MLRLFAAVIIVATPAVLCAQARDTTSLPRVVITATKVDSRIGSGIASVSVLNGDSLRRRGVHDVAEALREVPGAAIVRSGSFGAQTSLFMRGGESDYVRVLIDGVAMNDPGGSIDLASYTLDNVDRIEIVRGPTSVLYGSDAVSGVIQIFTSRPSATREAALVMSAGSYGARAGEISLGFSRAEIALSAGIARRTSDGILAFNNSYENDALSARVGWTPRHGSRLSVSARQQRDEYHYPTDGGGAIVDRNAFRTERRGALALEATQQLARRADLEIALTAMEGRPRTEDAADDRADTTGFYAYRSAGVVRRRVADARVNVRLPWTAIATFGGEYQTEAQHARDSSNFDAAPNVFRAERITRAIYSQVVGESRRMSYTLGGRYDDNDVFGIFRTARAGAALRVGNATTLRANAGSAFKAPTFLEQFNTTFTVGNTELRPERSRSVEVGIVHEVPSVDGELGATLFTQRFRDLIQYSYVNPTAANYFNVAAASARGIELEAQARMADATRVSAAITLLRTRVDDAGFDTGANATFVQGNRLLRRPSVTGSLQATTRLTSHVAIDARALLVGSRDDRDFSSFPATPIVLESYRRVDAGVTYRLSASGGLELFARAENLFGATYHEIANFAAPGRAMTVGVRGVTRR